MTTQDGTMKTPGTKSRRILAGIAFAILAITAGLGLHASSVTWNINDIFVGFDNQFGAGDTNPSHYQVLDGSTGVAKDDVSLNSVTSYTSGCAFDPNSTNVDLWTSGYWDKRVKHFSGIAPHNLIEEINLSALGGTAVTGIVFTKKSTGETGVYVSTSTPITSTNTSQLYYFKTPLSAAALAGTPDATFNLDTTGYRGIDWIDLAADQRTLYYSSLDDLTGNTSVIRTYDLVSKTQGVTISPTTDGTTTLATAIYSFRILPPGDGTGGFLVATNLDVFRIDATGKVKAAYTQNDDFRQQMTARGLPNQYSFFIDANVTNDGQYFWAEAYPQYEDLGTDPTSGNEIFDVTTPGQLFKFHIPTGSVQAGPFDLGKVGDKEFADGVCLKREYIASVEQPPCPFGSTDYRCSPVPDCTNPVVKATSPFCVVPGAPTITQLVDNVPTPTVTYAPVNTSALLTNSENDTVKVQVVANSGITNPALTYSMTGLPDGLTFNAITGLITGTIAYDAGGACGTFCTVQLTVTNATGRMISASFEWRVNETNFPPVVTPVLGALVYQHGQAINPLTVSATDLDPGDGIGFTLTPAVPGLSFGPTPTSGSRTQILSGIPTVAAGVPCPNDICSVTATTLFADDRKGSPVVPTQSTLVNISILNAPPTMVQPTASQTTKPGQAYSLQIGAADTNGDALTYSLSAGTSGLVISQTGLITGAPAAGVYTVVVTAADGHGDSVSKSYTLTASTNAAPVCSLATASPSSLWPPDHRFVNVSVKGVTDPDGDAVTIKVTRILQDETTLASGHYDGDGCNGHHHVSGDQYDQWYDNGSGNTSIDGIIGYYGNQSTAQVRAERDGTSDGRVYQILFAATDPAGASCQGSVNVGVPHDQSGQAAVDSLVRYDSTVAGGNPLQGPPYNLAPVYTNPGDQTTNIGKVVTLNTAATDQNLDTLSYTATGLPAGLSIKSTTGQITGTATTGGASTVTLKVSDPYGGTSTVTFKWTVVPNRPPVAVSDSVTISKGGSITVNVLANDSDPDGDSIKITGISGYYNGTAQLTNNNTAIYYKPTSSFVGTTQFAYTISDGKGGTATATLRITVSTHKSGDNCDHDKHRNGHYDGDGCEHDRACSTHH
ncbi:MAG TPA: putative Ig domain-containing protein [Vicinamibacterales bacterium]|jgi:hypothetical protein|nr:putative Ig domain-containing protein [Vicinamibacterales bacterium]